MFALRSARGTKLAKRFDARDLQTDLKREAMLTAPDHIWVADITYIRLPEEFVWSETELQRRANICSYGKDDGKRRKGKCDRVRHSPDDCGPLENLRHPRVSCKLALSARSAGDV
jgi:hypothetical protein